MKGCIAICDDEKVWIEQAYEAVQTYQKHKMEKFQIFQYHSAEEYLASGNSADILLLDIKMKDISGIELKNKLATGRNGEAIIFMSNYDCYMKEAFGRNVYGFLDKPISIEKLSEIFERIMADREINALLQIKTNQFVMIGKIIYIRAIDKYVEIHSREGVMTGYLSLGECERTLPECAFMRVHKSYIIHFKYVEKIGAEVLMKNNIKIKVGRGKLKGLREKYFQYAKMRAR